MAGATLPRAIRVLQHRGWHKSEDNQDQPLPSPISLICFIPMLAHVLGTRKHPAVVGIWNSGCFPYRSFGCFLWLISHLIFNFHCRQPVYSSAPGAPKQMIYQDHARQNNMASTGLQNTFKSLLRVQSSSSRCLGFYAPFQHSGYSPHIKLSGCPATAPSQMSFLREAGSA